MSKQPNEKPKESHGDLFDLFGWMGAALTQWQNIEDSHYLFFLKILGAPKPEVCSVIYFSPPTFESRRVMVDRVAYYAIIDKEHKKDWKKLNKRLGAAASERGKIAHYGLGFEVIKTGPRWSDFELGPARLEPSKHNKIAALKGQAIEDLKHHVTAKELRGYIANFLRLKKDLENFTKKIAVPQPQQGLGLLSGLLPFLGTQEIPNLSLPMPKPSGKLPSDQ